MTPHKDYCLDLPPSVPTPLLPQSPVLSEALQVCHPHAAGIDIGEAEHWVAVPPGCDPQPVRRFGTFTADLDVLGPGSLTLSRHPTRMVRYIRR